jgi:hypothetical protein
MKELHQQQAAGQPWLWRFADDEVRVVTAERADRWVQVECGRLWLTQTLHKGRADDHWLQAGERLLLPAGSTWVAQGVDGARLALLQAPPQPAGFTRFPGGAALAGVLALAGLAARAASAACKAKRAQGCISAGESMASSGTV